MPLTVALGHPVKTHGRGFGVGDTRPSLGGGGGVGEVVSVLHQRGEVSVGGDAGGRPSSCEMSVSVSPAPLPEPDREVSVCHEVCFFPSMLSDAQCTRSLVSRREKGWDGECGDDDGDRWGG